MGVYYPRLLRDGWTLDEPIRRAGWIDRFEKPLAYDWMLVKLAHRSTNPPPAGDATGMSIFFSMRVNRHRIGTPDWSGPLGADNDQAAVLTGGRAFSSSNWLGLRYPSAECRRRSLYFSMKRGRCSATSSWVSKAIG